MRLTRLIVQNWCQHARFEGEFGRGLTAIIGPNGSGKSNLLGAIRWGLTGDNPNVGVKADNVNQLARKGERSYASLGFEHCGANYEVTRYLLPEREKARLTRDGVEIAQGDQLVNAAIVTALGIDTKIINRFVLVAQNDIFGFIDDQSAEVDKFFQRLFDTSAADRAQEAVGKHVGKIAIPDIGPQLDDVHASIQRCEVRITQLEPVLASMAQIDNFLKLQQDDQELINLSLRRQGVATQVQSVGFTVTRLEQELVAKTADLQAKQADATTFQQARDNIRGAADAARLALSRWEAYKQAQAMQQQLAQQRQALLQNQATHPEPVAPDYYPQYEAFAAESRALENAITDADRMLREFDATGVAECPTCHTPTANILPYIAGLKNALPQQRERAAELSELRRLCVEYMSQRGTWERWKATWDVQMAKLTGQEQQLQSQPMPTDPEDALRKTIGDHDDFVRALGELEPHIFALQSEVARAQGDLSHQRSQLASLQQQLTEMNVTEEQVVAARARILERNQQFNQRSQLDGELQACRQLLVNLQQQQQQLQQRVHEAAAARRWVQQCEEYRSVLKAVPRFVAQANLQRLQAGVNEILAILETGFTVEASQGLTFTATFVDGRKQPARRLSGGQKVALALSFRIAVNSMFAENVGLLALDEPTAYLDQQRIRSLAPVFERLRSLSAARGLQCLMVTHEDELAPLFEAAIQLA